MAASRQADVVQAEPRVLHLHLKAASDFQAARMRVLKPTPIATRPHLQVVPLPRPSMYKPSHTTYIIKNTK